MRPNPLMATLITTILPLHWRPKQRQVFLNVPNHIAKAAPREITLAAKSAPGLKHESNLTPSLGWGDRDSSH